MVPLLFDGLVVHFANLNFVENILASFRMSVVRNILATCHICMHARMQSYACAREQRQTYPGSHSFLLLTRSDK